MKYSSNDNFPLKKTLTMKNEAIPFKSDFNKNHNHF